MAVSFNTQSTRRDAGFGASSITFSFNANVSSLDCLVVFSWTQTSLTTSSVTFNGTALTKIDQQAQTGEASIWYLAAPAAGANNVVVNFSGAAAFAGSCHATSFTGVHQTVTVGAASKSANAGVTSASDDAASASDDMAIDTLMITTSKTPSVSGAQTQLINGVPSYTVANAYLASSGNPTTMGWSWTGAASFAHIAFALKTAVAAQVPFSDSTVDINLYCEATREVVTGTGEASGMKVERSRSVNAYLGRSIAVTMNRQS